VLRVVYGDSIARRAGPVLATLCAPALCSPSVPVLLTGARAACPRWTIGVLTPVSVYTACEVSGYAGFEGDTVFAALHCSGPCYCTALQRSSVTVAIATYHQHGRLRRRYCILHAANVLPCSVMVMYKKKRQCSSLHVLTVA
jgi:hypothetical protein